MLNNNRQLNLFNFLSNEFQEIPKNHHYKEVHESKESFEEVPLITACLTYLGFYLLMIIGYLNQLFFVPKVATEKNRDGYVPLFDSFEGFYLRYVYRRVKDCWNRPICSCPADTLVLKDRITRDYGWTFEFTGTTRKCLNLGSYNYLGFAQTTGPCAEDSIESIEKYGIATASSRRELGKFFEKKGNYVLRYGYVFAYNLRNDYYSSLFRNESITHRTRRIDGKIPWSRRSYSFWNGFCYKCFKFAISFISRLSRCI